MIVWTGFLWEDFFENTYSSNNTRDINFRKRVRELLKYIDVLVDGPFVKQFKNDSTNLPYAGSSNQRVIDVKKSLELNNIILYNN